MKNGMHVNKLDFNHGRDNGKKGLLKERKINTIIVTMQSCCWWYVNCTSLSSFKVPSSATEPLQALLLELPI
jgi:hypothetical protein